MRTGQQLEAFSTTFGLIASVALHLTAFAYVASATAHFDFDFELSLPTEVEFGVAEGMELAVAPTPAPKPTAGTIETEAAPGDAITIDAGVPDTEPEAEDRDRARPTETAPDPRARPPGRGASDSDSDPDSEPDSDPISAPALEGPSRLPPGAQLALRIDMKRVRESPLGPDVTQFLRGVPDWQLILDGSGIDPVADLDRLLVATPNLQRSKLVLAGKHRRDASFARTSVKRLGRARGRPVRWQQRFGVRSNESNRHRSLITTRRVLAVIKCSRAALPSSNIISSSSRRRVSAHPSACRRPRGTTATAPRARSRF